jgi:hypothetical protein
MFPMPRKQCRDIGGLTGINHGDSRGRHGILNFVGEVSKVLYGTLDENDAKYYEEQIRHFERNTRTPMNS